MSQRFANPARWEQYRGLPTGPQILRALHAQANAQRATRDELPKVAERVLSETGHAGSYSLRTYAERDWHNLLASSPSPEDPISSHYAKMTRDDAGGWWLWTSEYQHQEQQLEDQGASAQIALLLCRAWDEDANIVFDGGQAPSAAQRLALLAEETGARILAWRHRLHVRCGPDTYDGLVDMDLVAGQITHDLYRLTGRP